MSRPAGASAVGGPDAGSRPLRPGRAGMPIPPVLVVNTGRCGSTMLSDIINRHPDILSLSELFSHVYPSRWIRHRRMTGDRMWRILSKPTWLHRTALGRENAELLYPFDNPRARFTPHNLPPILGITLPHLTERHEELFEELESVVRAQPRQPPAEHFRHLFGWLGERFGAKVWVERSGGSIGLGYGGALLRTFPEARAVHLYRDGRDVALSMSAHHASRRALRFVRRFESLGVDIVDLLSEEHSPWPVRLRVALGAAVTMHLPEKLERDPQLPEFGGFWSQLIEVGSLMLSQLPPERRLDVRLEDLQTDPEGQLRRLVRFIDPGLEHEEWLREVSSIPRPVSSRFALLGAADRAALTEACRPGLERLGYPM